MFKDLINRFFEPFIIGHLENKRSRILTQIARESITLKGFFEGDVLEHLKEIRPELFEELQKVNDKIRSIKSK